MYQFGVGGIFARVTGGNLASPSYPQQFGTLQDVNVEIDQKLQELRGQNKFPDDIAPGDMTIKGKAAFARLEVDTYNSLYFADGVTAGVKVIVNSEKDTVSANEITVAGAANFVNDMGVWYGDGSGPLVQVTAGNEAAGKYSVIESGANKGQYTFAAADNNKAMLVSYVKNDTGNGKTLTVVNHLQGYGPVFELYLAQPYQGNNGMHLFACRASKMSAPMKRDGYTISDFEFQAYANSAGNVMEWFQVSA